MITPGQAARFPMASDYGDLSRHALEADLDVGELRSRLTQMSERALLEFGRAAAHMCTPYASLGHPPRQTVVLQLAEARAEWRRRARLSSAVP